MGDNVTLDGMNARIVLLIEPHSPVASDFDCEDSGGVLVSTSDYGKMLIKLDTSQEWTLRRATID